MNLFMLLGVALLLASLLAAAAAFAGQKYLEGVATAKESRLKSVEQGINRESVEDFIRLRNRLTAGKTLLDRHVELTRFFDALEAVTLQNVRFSSLSLSVAEDRTATISMEGSARSFNALAAESSAFAAEKRIRRAIFSDISTERDGTVGFTLTADVDPALITSAGATGAAAVVAPAQPPVTAPVPSKPAATTTAGAAIAPTAPATTTKPAL
jgi:hypothetical protein